MKIENTMYSNAGVLKGVDLKSFVLYTNIGSWNELIWL